MEKFFEDYLQCLQALHQNFEAAFSGLPQEALDWVPGQDMNSLTVLVVHVVGAERYWVGDMGLNEPSARDRDAEFRAHGLSEADLKQRLSTSQAYIRGALERLTLADLATMRYSARQERELSVAWSLLHSLEHTGLHLGHAQLTRQLWDQR